MLVRSRSSAPQIRPQDARENLPERDQAPPETRWPVPLTVAVAAGASAALWALIIMMIRWIWR
jgi:hypothetical protein